MRIPRSTVRLGLLLPHELGAQFPPHLRHKILIDGLFITSPEKPKAGTSPAFLMLTNQHNTHIMIRPNQHNPSSRRPAPHLLKNLLLLPAAGIFLSLCSCKGEISAPSPPLVISTAPVGEGLKVIGFAMLGAAVVGVLGRMLK